MWFKINFDINKIMNNVHKNIKKEHLFGIECPKCKNIVWKYTHDYLKNKWELFCEVCENSFLIDINYKIK